MSQNQMQNKGPNKPPIVKAGQGYGGGVQQGQGQFPQHGVNSGVRRPPINRPSSVRTQQPIQQPYQQQQQPQPPQQPPPQSQSQQRGRPPLIHGSGGNITNPSAQGQQYQPSQQGQQDFNTTFPNQQYQFSNLQQQQSQNQPTAPQQGNQQGISKPQSSQNPQQSNIPNTSTTTNTNTSANIPPAQRPPVHQASSQAPIRSGRRPPMIGSVINASTGQIGVTNQQTITMPVQASTNTSTNLQTHPQITQPQVQSHPTNTQQQTGGSVNTAPTKPPQIQSQPKSSTQQTESQSQAQNQSQEQSQSNKPPQTQPSQGSSKPNEKTSKPTDATEQKDNQSNRRAASRTKPWSAITGDKPDPKNCGWARARSVLSGDTILLAISQPKEQTGPVKLITLTLEGIRAPRIARKPGGDDDEFGLESREFVRKAISNKNIFFAVWRQAKESKMIRYFGDIYIPSGKDQTNRESLTRLVVENGWADLKSLPNPEQQAAAKTTAPTRESPILSPTEVTKLVELNKQAKNKKVGKYQENSSKLKRKLQFITKDSDRADLFEELKDQEITAIVDQIREGTTLRLELLIPDSPQRKLILVHLAGCTAPRMPIPKEVHEALMEQWAAGGKKDPRPKPHEPPLPFAAEAKEFVEARLSGQEVKVKMLTCDQTKHIFATVSHTFGRITALLLKQGLASFQPWTASLCDKSEQEAMKEAYEEAKKARRGIWKDQDPNQIQSENEGRVGIVTQVISGDTLMVKFEDENDERRYTLSSIQAPKLTRSGKYQPNNQGDKKTEEKTEDKNEDIARLAKDYLRKKTIGQNVHVFKEYDRAATEQMRNAGIDKQVFATVYVNNENIAVGLVKSGFANVIRHPQHQSRSRDYDQLIKAELHAQKQKAGLHNTQRKRENIIDLSIRQDDKPLYDQLKKDRINLYNALAKKRKHAVVEFVFSGNRLKLYIPEKKRYIPLMLAGIRCDTFSLGKPQNSQWGTAAYELLKNKLLQREVEVQITQISEKDGMHTFLGNIYYENQNIAAELIEKGLAEVIRVREKKHGRYVEVQSDPQLLELETKAKENLVGWWKDVTPQEDKKTEEAPQKTLTGTEMNVIVSHIESASSFYVNESGDNKMEELEHKMSVIPKAHVGGKLKPGRLVAALYDGLYARAKLMKKDQRSEQQAWLVLFIDYGNRASVTVNNMVAIPQNLRTDGQFPPLAHRCILAGLRAPSRQDPLYNDAGHYFAELALNKEIKMKILLDEWGKGWHVDLLVNNDSVNTLLARDGYLRFDKYLAPGLKDATDESTKKYLKNIQEAIEEARRARKNIWQFDIDSDEEQ